MSGTWLTNATVVPGQDGGTFIGSPWRGVLHTTEGPSIASAVGEFRTKNVWPHLTIDPGTQEVVQHLSLDVAARALQHPAGTPETNRANCIQIEIIGRATDSPTWSGTALEFIAGVMRMVEEKVPVARQSALTYKSFPASFGLVNGVRMSDSEWAQFTGWCGHQHVPNNSHGDPGQIDINYLCSPRTIGLGSSPSCPGPAVVNRTPTTMDVILGRSLGAPRAISWDSNWSAGVVQVGDGQVPVGGTAGVAAVARRSDVIDTFWVGTDGSLQTAWWTRAGGWAPSHLTIGDPSVPASDAGGITVLGRLQELLDVFFVGQYGRMHTTWWTPATGWNTPTLTLAGALPVDTASGVAAVNRNRDTLDVFCIGEDENLYTLSWRAGSGWASTAQMIAGARNSVNATSGCAAVARDTHHMDVVYVGGDAHLYAVGWDETTGWAPAARIDTGTNALASKISGPTIVSRKKGVLDVFWLDATGHVFTTWWTESGLWSGTALQLGPLTANMAPTLSPVAVARRPESLNVFVVDWSYHVNTIQWTAAGGWDAGFTALILSGW